MALESPSTYAEWYWAMGLESQKAFNEVIEQALAPLFSSLIADTPELSELPFGTQSLLSALSTPASPGLGNLLVAAGGDFASNILKETLGPAMSMLRRSINRRAKETWLTPEQAVILSQRKKIDDKYFYLLTQSAGYEDIVADSLFDSFSPYPPVQDIITYARYNSDPYNPKELIWKKFAISPDDYDMWYWLSLMRLTTEQVQSLYVRKVFNDYQANFELTRIGWDAEDIKVLLDLSYILPNPMLLAQGLLLQGKPDDIIKDNITTGGISPKYTDIYFDGILTKPSTADIIAFELRRQPSLVDLDKELRKIGIHPAYYQLYKELAYPIPPVADIITMAVREAFTPDIAARFGQYEGLPADYVTWVGKKGISKEWAERYWAAHWSLPSPQQGFEMLHRGVISREDLMLLLRALDIMPFWRDKLINISYNPLTRVDVRRMFNLGVITTDEVNQAYQDIGYNKENAERLTKFTVKLKQQADERLAASEAKVKEEKTSTWTTAQTIGFYKKGLMNESRAKQELDILGYNEEHINIYLKSVTIETEE